MMENSSSCHYCLICFTKFKGLIRRASQSEPGSGRGGGGPELFRKFLLFSQQYLSIPRGDVLPFVNGREGRDVFCENCGGVVDSICRLYKELCEVQLQLAWKLGQLGELVEIANGGGGGSGSAMSILETLGSQLGEGGGGTGGGGGGKVVEDLRAGVALQCDRQFRNGQKLEGILSAHSTTSNRDDGGTSDNASIGICCDVEVDIIKGDAHDNLASQYFIQDAIGKTSHFLCDQSSSEESPLGQPTDGDGKKVVECHQCHKTFAHKYSLEKHLRTQHGIETTFSCSECNLEFHTRQQHQQHQNEFHCKRKGEGQGQGGSGSGSSSPRKKIRREEENPNKLHKCSECGNQFSSWDFLMDHMNAHRKKQPKKKGKGSSKPPRPLIPPGWKECPQCREGFPPSAFYYHVRKVHGQGQRHVCPEPGCGKEFLFPTGLKRHLLHHGEKRFECPTCQKKFSQFPTLKRHSETQHGQTLEIDKSQQRHASPHQQSPASTGANYSGYSGGSGGSNDSGHVPFQQQAYPHVQPSHVHQLQPNQIVGQRWMVVPSWPS